MHLIRNVFLLVAIVLGAVATAPATWAKSSAATGDNRVINRVAFEGNNRLKSDQLAGIVLSKAYYRFDAAKAQNDVERIAETYRRNGRNAIKVTYRTVPIPDGRVDLVFSIDEGSKTGINSIQFVGNKVFSSSKLRGLMTSTESNFLSFFKSSDVYDPDTIQSDEELIRNYYLKNGYADFRVISTQATYGTGKKGVVPYLYSTEAQGYTVTITVDEGPQYTVASSRVDSRVPDLPPQSLDRALRIRAGDVYNGVAVQKTLEALTRQANRRGHVFVQVRPRGDRNPATRTIGLSFVVEDGPRVYIERINIHGNTRTRDYVIRREFDIGEGDAYNRVLIDIAERRLNSLGYFKKVRITNLPGSASDKVIVDVEVEDQPTGSFSVSGGYSTTDGVIGEVAVSESNFLGRGQFVRLAVSAGQYADGVELSFTEPYFLNQRIAAGVDLFAKYSNNSLYTDYASFVTGGTLRFGLPFTDEITLTPRYSLYNTNISVNNDTTSPFNDCTSPIVGFTPGTVGAPGIDINNNCLANGEASQAIKEARGNTLTSLVGFTLSYNTLDNIKNPSAGLYATLSQDFAGAGGDSQFVRTTGDVRYYHNLYFDDVVGIARVQGGNIFGYGSESTLRISDQFQLGPELVRGFAPAGLGPRDISPGIDSTVNPLGGTSYFGGSLEMQFPLGLPKELGFKGAIFADAGTLLGYQGRVNFGGGGSSCPDTRPAVVALLTQSNCVTVRDDNRIRSSVGASLIWASPLGPIRFDYAFVLSKDKYDDTQAFRFSGGTTF